MSSALTNGAPVSSVCWIVAQRWLRELLVLADKHWRLGSCVSRLKEDVPGLASLRTSDSTYVLTAVRGLEADVNLTLEQAVAKAPNALQLLETQSHDLLSRLVLLLRASDNPHLVSKLPSIDEALGKLFSLSELSEAPEDVHSRDPNWPHVFVRDLIGQFADDLEKFNDEMQPSAALRFPQIVEEIKLMTLDSLQLVIQEAISVGHFSIDSRGIQRQKFVDRLNQCESVHSGARSTYMNLTSLCFNDPIGLMDFKQKDDPDAALASFRTRLRRYNDSFEEKLMAKIVVAGPRDDLTIAIRPTNA